MKMALVEVLDADTFQKIGKKRQDTDVAAFFYDENKRTQLIMKRPPEVMDVPKINQPGSIRLNKHKTVPLNLDNTFYYGVWPQDAPSDEVQRRLNKEKGDSTTYYYRIKGITYYESQLDDRLYVKINGKGKWFEVKFIKWQYDPKLGRAYTEKALWNLDESDDKQLGYFWLQAFQSTEILRQAQERRQSSLKNRLKNGTKGSKKNTIQLTSQSTPEV